MRCHMRWKKEKKILRCGSVGNEWGLRRVSFVCATTTMMRRKNENLSRESHFSIHIFRVYIWKMSWWKILPFAASTYETSSLVSSYAWLKTKCLNCDKMKREWGRGSEYNQKILLRVRLSCRKFHQLIRLLLLCGERLLWLNTFSRFYWKAQDDGIRKMSNHSSHHVSCVRRCFSTKS